MKTAPLLLLIAGCSAANASNGPSGDRPVAELAVSPALVLAGQSISLDASNSYDPDNAAPAPPHGIAEYVWTLDQGAGASLAGSGAAVFVATVTSGMHAGSLVVVDEDGLESEAEPFSVNVEPPPNTTAMALRVSVSWDIDSADVNLHLVEQTAGGSFGVAPFDCFFSNKTPDWGEPGSENDPTLDVDDTDGFGPENITVATQDGGVTYRVVVHYFSDDGLGATTALVRIYFNDALAFEDSASLSNDNVWDVATITDGIVSAF